MMIAGPSSQLENPDQVPLLQGRPCSPGSFCSRLPPTTAITPDYGERRQYLEYRRLQPVPEKCVASISTHRSRRTPSLALQKRPTNHKNPLYCPQPHKCPAKPRPKSPKNTSHCLNVTVSKSSPNPFTAPPSHHQYRNNHGKKMPGKICPAPTNYPATPPPLCPA